MYIKPWIESPLPFETAIPFETDLGLFNTLSGMQCKIDIPRFFGTSNFVAIALKRLDVHL